MQIDETRWQKLLDEIASLSALNRGYNATIEDMMAQRNRAAAELARAEASAQTTPIVRPPHPRLAPGAEPPQNVLRDTWAGRETALQPARDELARVEAACRRMNAAADASFGRLGRLRRLEAECRQWAAQHGVTLPGEASGSGRAVIPPSQGGREFSPHLAAAVAGEPTPATMSPPGGNAIGGGVFGRLRGALLP